MMFRTVTRLTLAGVSRCPYPSPEQSPATPAPRRYREHYNTRAMVKD